MRKLKPAHFLACVDYWPCASFPALRCLWVLVAATWIGTAARAGTAEDAFVVCPNRTPTRAGRMPWSTRGQDDEARGVEEAVGPAGGETKTIARETTVRRDATRLVSSIITRSPSHNNVNCTSVPSCLS
ncbi:hypothetical protein B0H14DRAFT_2979787, partial [Mycena olivaceomarginata]